MLTARALSVTLNRRLLLERINFTARSGEITAIVGPNGSGKTTLLRALAGDLPFTGSAHLDGLDLARAPAWHLATRRAVLAQHTPVGFPFTALEVVSLGLSASLTRDTDPRAALAQVGLAGYDSRPFPELSGGEQQRVHLARVLAQLGAPTGPDGPRWLMLDEPVSALDIGHQLLVMGLARDFAAGGGGVIAVMHDLNLTALCAHSVALLSQGRLRQQGPVAEVIADAPLSQAYRCPLRLNRAPTAGPWFLPQMAGETPAPLPDPRT
jgi:iron complex transport system ATP-binding protein